MTAELDLTLILCTFLLQGEVEVRHEYAVLGEQRHIRVDCETPTHVIEVGLDARRSSYDSLHQALFAAHVTGKQPMVVIVDTNGVEDRAEYQIRTVARQMGVAYRTYDVDFLLRWRMTWPFRRAREAVQQQTAPPTMN